MINDKPATTSTMADSTTTDQVIAFSNAKFFLPKSDGTGSAQFAQSLLIRNGKIEHVGSQDDIKIKEATDSGVKTQDLGGKYVLPAFVDGHVHLMLLGLSMTKVNIEDCQNLEDIRRTIKEYAQTHPDAKRILCRGWMHPMTNGEATTKMLEGIDDRPIFIESKDLHSSWCNEAAIQELNIQDTPDPVGGTIFRNESGKPSGLISEAANLTLVWPHIARVVSMEEKTKAIRAAINAYIKAGYSGICDLAMDENSWEALTTLTKAEQFPLRISAYWLINPSGTTEGDIKQVDRAISLTKQYNQATSPNLRVVGIKLILDGIVDACTATLLEPYANGQNADPVWTKETMAPVINHASKASIQCALHAIGDKSISDAIDTLEKYGKLGARHRIEHLELCSASDAARLGKLGITASIQAVHADPEILKAWPKLLGEHRCSRAFAYHEFLDGGATLALGTDAPTAPHYPMPNLYTATTRRSARKPESETVVNKEFALSLFSAISGYTEGTAYSCFSDHITGSLRPGLSADFVVVDMEWEADKLLKARVVETWHQGLKV